MAVQTGDRIGPYELKHLLGAGGMGEVFQAVDTRLDRLVAMKFIKGPFHERYQVEARSISALSHPHICTLFDVGVHDGAGYLVMEFIDGKPLKGPLPVEDVLTYGWQIADAMAEAHRKSIVHRDLKPSNILLAKQGVKLLDFGLAKILQAPIAETEATLTQHPLTQRGAIMGTLQYMSPEQLEGKEVDERSDIFAFGLILHELVTGQRVFNGTSQASLAAAILKEQAAPLSDPVLDRVVRRCLAKDPEQRWQSAADLADELRWLKSAPVAPAGRRAPSRRWMGIAAAFAAGVLLAAAGAVALSRGLREEAPPKVVRFTVAPPPGYGATANQVIALAPDEATIVFRAASSDGTTAYLRHDLATMQTRLFPGLGSENGAFFSPDSKWIAFTQGGLKKMNLESGTIQPLDARNVQGGGSWSRDGLILLAAQSAEGRRRIDAIAHTGGASRVVVPPDPKATMSRPYWLPDGRRFLYFRSGLTGNLRGEIVLATTDQPQGQVLTTADSQAVYIAPSGRHPAMLLLTRDDRLLASGFDERTGKVADSTTLLADQINPGFRGQGIFAATGGVLVYQSGEAFTKRRLCWLSRTGSELGCFGPEESTYSFELSPDGKRAVIEVVKSTGGSGQLSVVELERGATYRLTRSTGWDYRPVWSEDSRFIAFSRNAPDTNGFFRHAADGSGNDELLFNYSAGTWFAHAWNRTGIYLSGRPPQDAFLFVPGTKKPEPVFESPFDRTDPRPSPDLRWLAYTHREEGKPAEVFLQALSEDGKARGGRYPVSSNGGSHPRWRRDGRELFYVAPGGKLMAVPVTLGAAPRIGTAQLLMTLSGSDTGASRAPYDVSGDGTRILAAVPREQIAAPPIQVVLNWRELVK